MIRFRRRFASTKDLAIYKSFKTFLCDNLQKKKSQSQSQYNDMLPGKRHENLLGQKAVI